MLSDNENTFCTDAAASTTAINASTKTLPRANGDSYSSSFFRRHDSEPGYFENWRVQLATAASRFAAFTVEVGGMLSATWAIWEYTIGRDHASGQFLYALIVSLALATCALLVYFLEIFEVKKFKEVHNKVPPQLKRVLKASSVCWLSVFAIVWVALYRTMGRPERQGSDHLWMAIVASHCAIVTQFAVQCCGVTCVAGTSPVDQDSIKVLYPLNLTGISSSSDIGMKKIISGALFIIAYLSLFKFACYCRWGTFTFSNHTQIDHTWKAFSLVSCIPL